MNKRLAILTASLWLAGCATLPGMQPVPPTAATPPGLPNQWAASAPAGASTLGERWWSTVFNDPRLDALVDEALKSASSVRQALERVEEARATLRLADAQRTPLVGAQLSAARSATSGAVPGNARSTGNLFGAGVQASWEPDVWGRLARESEAAQADLAIARIDVDATRLMLAAEVARGYYGLRVLDEQVIILTRTIEQQRQALALQRKRAEAGILSDYELRQLEAEIATLQATLPGLAGSREQAQTALLVLVGRAPQAIMGERIDSGAPVGAAPSTSVPPPRLPDGLPSDLLLRRPDLAQARQAMIAADARADAIRLSAFPQVALTGSLGSQSARLSDLFSGPAFVWSLGASVAQTLFEGGRREATSEVYRSRQRQALLGWQAAVAQAFGEVRSALAAQTSAAQASVAQRERIAALQRVLELARLRFDNGVASQLDVLDAERSLLSARAALAEAEHAQRLATIDMIRALGGGWTAP